MNEYRNIEYYIISLLYLYRTVLLCPLLLQDVKLTASNDDCYFVFEDFLYQVSVNRND